MFASPRTSRRLLAAIALSTGIMPFASAQLQWDTVPGNLTADGGVGVWDTTTPNWFDGASNRVWNFGDAVFGLPHGGIATITLPSGGMVANSLTLNANNTIRSDESDGDLTDDYLLVNQPLKLIVHDPGATIAAAIVGPSSLEISGGYNIGITAHNTYTGGTTIIGQSGVFMGQNPDSLGLGAITLRAGIIYGLDLKGVFKNTVRSLPGTVPNALNLFQLSPGQVVSGDIDLQADLGFGVTGDFPGGVVDFTGHLLGNGVARLMIGCSEGSSVRFTAQSSGAVPIFLQGGTLTLAAGADFSNSSLLMGDNDFRSPYTLAGNGRIGAIQARSGSVISPGENGIGTIYTGSITALPQVKLELGAAGTSDRLSIQGTAELGGLIFNLLDSFNPALGEIFYLVSNDGADSTTDVLHVGREGERQLSLREGQDFVLKGQIFTYTEQANFEGGSWTGGNDIAIKAVPEPAALAILALGGGVIGGRRQRPRASA